MEGGETDAVAAGLLCARGRKNFPKLIRIALRDGGQGRTRFWQTARKTIEYLTIY